MNLAPVIVRLQAQCPALRLVGGAADLDGAVDGLPASPAAFVVPMQSKGVRDGAGNLLEVETSFGVLIGIAAVGNLTSKATDDVGALSDSVRSALEGFRLTNARAMQWDEGHLHAFNPGVVWYLDTYSASLKP